MTPPLPISTLFPYTTLFRSLFSICNLFQVVFKLFSSFFKFFQVFFKLALSNLFNSICSTQFVQLKDRKSTRLNSSHRCISYAVFCLKKKNYKVKLSVHIVTL